MQHDLIDLGTVRLHVASAGSGPVLLFLHGFPDFWYAWRHQLHALSDQYRVVAPDLRGYNESDKPDGIEAYTLPILADDVRRLVEKLDVPSITLIGHDWGGAVAWSTAVLYPQLIDHLVIANMPHPVLFRRELATNPKQQQASAYMGVFARPGAEALLLADDCARLHAMVFGSQEVPAEVREAYHRAWTQPGAMTGALNYYRASALSAADERLQQALQTPVRIPTLVLWGEQDTALLASNLDGLSTLVPGVEIHRVPDATHWIIREQPDLVTRKIREFL